MEDRKVDAAGNDISQETPEYQAFVEKFRPKRTTDDCYTPPEIFEVIQDWVCNRYGVDPAKIVRPFWPGGDYERYDYPDGSVVVDNPPFSVLSKIIQFYLDRDIPFFLFCPALTAFGGKRTFYRATHIIVDADIVYENGAVVCTAFVTNMDDPDLLVVTAPDLGRAINTRMRDLRTTAKPPRYDYPDHVLTAARCQYYAAHGVNLEIRRGDCMLISALDSQRAAKKGIYGNGLLLSDRAAMEKAAADRAARTATGNTGGTQIDYVWTLSDRERDLVKSMGGNADG